jgi:hypothetical protein
VHPYRKRFPVLAAYFERLASRPASRRVIAEAQLWFQYFPFVHALEPRFLGPGRATTMMARRTE